MPPEVRKQATRGSGVSLRTGPYDYFHSSDATGPISSNILVEESSPDATSEKELGNEYFKQKNFYKAIECYSRSIALSPTSVAFANRAMAYLKVQKYEEAENDCTEALNLDDRYVKAYSRRATARKELGKFKASLEDSEFAMRLEPNNQELRKLHTETKNLYQKEIVNKISKSNASKSVAPGIREVGDSETRANENDQVGPATTVRHSTEKTAAHSGIEKTRGIVNTHELKAPMQELVARAASLVKANATKNITTPKSAYEFEVSWRALSDEPALQASLLKSIPPATLPQLFKSSLSAPMLVDITKCVATFFKEEIELAINVLDNLTKVSRFDMVVLCLSALDRSDQSRIWNDVFCSQDVPQEQLKALSKLRSKFCPR